MYKEDKLTRHLFGGGLNKLFLNEIYQGDVGCGSVRLDQALTMGLSAEHRRGGSGPKFLPPSSLVA